MRGSARHVCWFASAIAGFLLLSACGARSSLLEGRELELGTGGDEVTQGTGGSLPDGVGGTVGGLCDALPDFNSQPGQWEGVRIDPTVNHGYTVTVPSGVVWNHGVSLAFILSYAEGYEDSGLFDPGLWFAHKGNRIGVSDSAPVVEEFALQLIDPSGTAGASIATDGESLFIGYRTAGALKLATLRDGIWFAEHVPTRGFERADGDTQCRVDDDGVVHILYDDLSPYDDVGSIVHARKERDTWTVDTVAVFDQPDTVEALDFEVDPDGGLHALWIQNSGAERTLRYATLQGEWVIEEVPVPALPDDVALELTPEGLPDLVLLNRNLAQTPPFYGRRRAGAWEFEELNTNPEFQGYGFISFALGVDGVAHVVLSAFTSYYLTNRSGSWEHEPLALNADDGTAIFVEDSGAAHVTSRYFNFPQNVAPEYTTNRTLVPDGVDQNCDGVDGIDADGDGVASVWTGGLDCNDLDPSLTSCL